MIMSYNDRKQAVQEDFEEFHVKMGYSVKDTFYAATGEAEYSSLYTKTDECCICAAFSFLLIRMGIDCSFLYPELVELTSKAYMPQYKQELGADFMDFQQDVAHLKTLLGQAGQGAVE